MTKVTAPIMAGKKATADKGTRAHGVSEVQVRAAGVKDRQVPSPRSSQCERERPVETVHCAGLRSPCPSRCGDPDQEGKEGRGKGMERTEPGGVQTLKELPEGESLWGEGKRRKDSRSVPPGSPCTRATGFSLFWLFSPAHVQQENTDTRGTTSSVCILASSRRLPPRVLCGGKGTGDRRTSQEAERRGQPRQRGQAPRERGREK